MFLGGEFPSTAFRWRYSSFLLLSDSIDPFKRVFSCACISAITSVTSGLQSGPRCSVVFTPTPRESNISTLLKINLILLFFLVTSHSHVRSVILILCFLFFYCFDCCYDWGDSFDVDRRNWFINFEIDLGSLKEVFVFLFKIYNYYSTLN